MRTLALSASLVVGLASAPALAFPWMVKHDYQACAVCHVDPSGAGQLTPYGRAQSDVLLQWKLKKPTAEAAQEPSPATRFLWAVDLPEVVNLSGNFRNGLLIPIGSQVRPLFMAADLYGTVKLDRFVFHGSTGLGLRNVGPAAILPQCGGDTPCGAQWVAREFWAGATFADEAVMVRAGRMFLPFGLRNNEHFMWVRDTTGTDTNLDQQFGVAVSYNGEKLRGEVMGLLGNYQLGPDAYRERGYSAFAEYALASKAFLGMSSLITTARADPLLLRPQVRHAHGVTFRWSPVEPLAILAEADFLAWQQPGLLDRLGFAALLQGDYEPMQGLHLIASLEGQHTGVGEVGPSVGGWLSAAWYVLPHVELRFDTIIRRTARPAPDPAATGVTLLAQLHFFL
ncbi:MAG: hypothetical protein INH37_22255 [Myxococcaceae bacterium]|jgi:hypothetical protein|nr:hypothetical protein [Myxococcaceae bacterium]